MYCHRSYLRVNRPTKICVEQVESFMKNSVNEYFGGFFSF